MNYLTSLPSQSLKPFVKHYWYLESCITPGSIHHQRIVPSGLVELMFYSGDIPCSRELKESNSANTIVNGHQDKYYDLQIKGNFKLFSILFEPYSLPLFFNIPANELFNQCVPLKYLLKNQVTELEEKINSSGDFSRMIKIAEDFLYEQLQRSEMKNHFDRIRHTVHIINQNRGLVSVDSLAENACLSRKQFERSFSAVAGISPGKFLRIVRFQNAISLKARNENLNLTNLCYDSGYYDQPHMNAEFQKLSGMTPGSYFKDCQAYSDYFQ